MDPYFFGIAGLILLLVSWISECYQTIKSGSAKVPLEFALIYFFASSSLAYYSYLLGDGVFLVLNLASGLVALVNLAYILRPKNAMIKEKNKSRKSS